MAGSESETRAKMPRAPVGRVCKLSVTRLVDHQIPGRDRVSVRIVGRVSELGGDQFLELVGEDVLEHLSLVVDAIPGHAQALHQIQLEQPVMADHLQRDQLTGLGQGDPTVGLVSHEPELAQALDHARGGRRRDAEALGERVGTDGPIAAVLERVDRLAVVLDRGRTQAGFFLDFGHGDYGKPKP
jgi:hypothetical protein